MEESIEGARLHTAEHIFARALQEQGLDIHVRKADTYREDNIGKAYVKEIIPFEKIMEAEKAVNAKIIENLAVTEENFENLEQAIKQNPKLRFNEDRLDKEMQVRIVTIGQYDFSACKHRHVKQTNEIMMFAVKRISYLGGETEIEFLAGNDALLFLLQIKNEVLKAAMDRHFVPEKLSEYVKNENERIVEIEKEEKEMLYKLMESNSKLITLNGVKISKFYGEINYFIKMHPERGIAITNGQQITVMKGNGCKVDLLKMGEQLKTLGFTGNISQSSINGKADEKIVEEIDKLWKA
ncbi:hypothetical protein M1558_01565 [Candidatus Parvarchaeota archaeon]|nr:hypothetical protein [Candidatus Parvarchaeota archaeon]